MKLSLAVLASLLALASASTISATTEATEKNILHNLSLVGKQFAKINDLIDGFPQNGVKGATEIHEHETKLVNHFTDVFSGVKALPKPVPASFVQKILEAYQSFIPTAVKATNQITAKAPDFVTLSALATTNMKNDLISSGIFCFAAKETLDSIAPPSMAESLDNLLGLMEAALENGVAAFS